MTTPLGTPAPACRPPRAGEDEEVATTVYAVVVRSGGFVDRFVKRGSFADGKLDTSGYGYTNDPAEIWSHRDEVLARQVAELFRKATGKGYRFVVVRSRVVESVAWDDT